MSNKIMCAHCKTKSIPQHWLITTAFALGVSVEQITNSPMTLYEYFCPCCGLPNSIRAEDLLEDNSAEESEEKFKDNKSKKESEERLEQELDEVILEENFEEEKRKEVQDGED